MCAAGGLVRHISMGDSLGHEQKCSTVFQLL